MGAAYMVGATGPIVSEASRLYSAWGSHTVRRCVDVVCALQVVAVAATFCEVWSSVSGLIAELDVLAGFADLATADPTRPYCKPEILELDDGVVELKVMPACALTT